LSHLGFPPHLDPLPQGERKVKSTLTPADGGIGGNTGRVGCFWRAVNGCNRSWIEGLLVTVTGQGALSFDPEVSLRAERTQCETGPKGRVSFGPEDLPSTSRLWRETKCRIEGSLFPSTLSLRTKCRMNPAYGLRWIEDSRRDNNIPTQPATSPANAECIFGLRNPHT